MEGSLGPIHLSSFESMALWLIAGSAVLALVYGTLLVFRILSKDQGTDKMIEIAEAIQDGANAYLRRQFSTIAFFVVGITAVLYFTASSQSIAIGRSLAFLAGSLSSGLVGFIGMSLAVRGNVRTAAAAKKSFKSALSIAFQTGIISGMLTIGLGLLGATIIFIIYKSNATEVLVGFGFGAALLALFMRVGGGIFTKSADVGADLVGKLEKGIPEDDPRNAAVIADNVGDNVGDCAGMAADLFESYEVTLVSSMILGLIAFPHSAIGIMFPLFAMAVGAISSIIGTLVVRARSENESAMKPINRGFFLAALLSIVGVYFVASAYVRDLRVFWAIFTGLVLAASISILTEYYTSYTKKPVQDIAGASKSGPATVILSGIASGMESSVFAVIAIGIAIFSAIIIAGNDPKFILYGVSLIGMGMLSITGVIVSMDTYGPVADNANGIFEMAGETDKTAQNIMANLDAVGNTTKAITKGFAIASAVIAAISLFGSFLAIMGKGAHIRIDRPEVFVGLLIGGSVPYLFSSLTIRAVGRGAMAVVAEVRRQFREITGIMEYKNKPDYAAVTDIVTKTALRELIAPGLLAILTPIIIGLVLHAEALGGFLAGAILSGQLLAVFMSNAGGAWDNAKKYIEDGNYGGKGSEAHYATVIGDTVGDPFKDTAGPALDPLIKVMNLVALLIAPIIINFSKLNLIVGIIGGVGLALIVAAIWVSKRDSFGQADTTADEEEIAFQEA